MGDLELRVTIGKRADLELGSNLLEHVVGVVVHELRGRIRARVLEQDLAATGVVVKELGHVVDVALDGNPSRVSCRMLAPITPAP